MNDALSGFLCITKFPLVTEFLNHHGFLSGVLQTGTVRQYLRNRSRIFQFVSHIYCNLMMVFWRISLEIKLFNPSRKTEQNTLTKNMISSFY